MAVTTAAVVGVAISLGNATMSFSQARQQKKLGEEAKRDAQKAMAEAKKALEVNYYDQLAVKKEPYELEREALLAQGALATQAGVEGDRGAAATAGRVQAAMNDAQAGIRTGMGKEMSDLDKLSAEEDARLRDVGVQLNLEEVAGAQQAMADSAVAVNLCI
jgi:vacuolar-type H+-ATPase subunit H